MGGMFFVCACVHNQFPIAVDIIQQAERFETLIRHAVDEHMTVQAAANSARTEGVFECPETSTTLTALKKLLAEGSVDGSAKIAP